MAQIYEFDQNRVKNRHLENQDVFNDNASNRPLSETMDSTKNNVRDISSWGEGADLHDCSGNQLDSSRKLLDRWRYENRLNLKLRKDLSEQIEIDDNGIRIWNIYWEYSHMLLDTLDMGERYMKKHKLKIPTVEDVDNCAMILPWNTIQEKRINLLLLLWVKKDWNCRLWTSTKNIQSNEDDLWLWSDISEIAQVFRTKVLKFFNSDDSYCSLLVFYWTWINYYEAPRTEIWNICWTRQL